MQKIIMIMIMCVMGVFAILYGGVVSAATITDSTSIGDTAFKPSKNVTIKIVSDGQDFTAHSQHASGSKQYCGCGGTTNDCTTIKEQDAVDSGPSDVDSATAGCGSGWE